MILQRRISAQKTCYSSSRIDKKEFGSLGKFYALRDFAYLTGSPAAIPKTASLFLSERKIFP